MNAAQNSSDLVIVTTFLNRQEYDALVTWFPNWMADRWSRYTKMWSIGGVHVTARRYEIENLRIQVSQALELVR